MYHHLHGKLRSYKNLKRFSIIVVIIILVFGGIFAIFSQQKDKATAANAANWKAGFIISDAIFTDSNSMSTSQIQNFLNTQGQYCNSNCLKDYSQGGESAATIIRKAALDYGISPKTLIVLLQKEQGLVTHTSPGNYEYKYATGYCVTDSGLCGNYWGFRLQVRKAAQLFRNIMNSPNSSNYPPGTREILYNPNTACGRKTVTIQNAATSALYHYTPYTPNKAALDNLYSTGNGCSAYGNRNFWRTFTDWFGNPQRPPDFRLIICGDNKYLVERFIKAKRQVTAEAIDIWDLDNEVFIPNDVGCGYKTYDFELSRVIRSRDTKKLYVIDTSQAWYINSSSAASAWGFQDTYDAGLAGAPMLNGKTIIGLIDSVEGKIPRLAKSMNTGKAYLINNGKRYYLEESPDDTSSLELFRGYNDVSYKFFSADILLTLTDGGDVSFGFQSNGEWFVADHGVIRRIHPAVEDRWTDQAVSGPVLSNDIQNIISKDSTLTKGFRRDHFYYRLNPDSGAVEVTTSKNQAIEWGVSEAPIITNLLRNKLTE